MLTLEELNRRFNRLEVLLNSVGLIQPGSLAPNTISADNIVAGSITATELTITLDDVPDGSSYSRVLTTSISAGKILLDEVTAGTYGKVLTTDISAGHILLSATVGDLDNVADGITYGKVALTGISAGKIVVAGLDSGVTTRMFLDATTKTNIEAWRHASDVTLIDGGDIYTGSVTASKITVANLSALSADMGTLTAGAINMFTGTWDVSAAGFRLTSGEIAIQNGGLELLNINVDGTVKFNQGAVTLGQSFANYLELDIAAAAGGLYILNTSDATLGPIIYLDHYTTNIAAYDYPGQIIFRTHRNDPPNYTLLDSFKLGNYLTDVTASSEDSGVEVSLLQAGAITKVLTLNSVGHLSTYGYIYPGTGAAIQATRYIYDDGSDIRISGGLPIGDIVGTLWQSAYTVWSWVGGSRYMSDPGVAYVSWDDDAGGYFTMAVPGGATHVQLLSTCAGNEAGNGKGIKITIGGSDVEITWDGAVLTERVSGWIALATPLADVTPVTLYVKGSSATEDMTVCTLIMAAKRVIT